MCGSGSCVRIMKERGRLFRWIFWKIVEIFVVLFCSISFFISWIHYRRQLSPKTIKNSSSINLTKECKEKEGIGKLSIIIAIKNEAKYIGKTIRNFESTTINKSAVEIIIVDSGCKDNSLEVARASAGVVPIKFVRHPSSSHQHQSTRGSSFNQGAEVATGDYLLFLRADCLVPPGYDETIRRELSNSSTLVTAFRFSYDVKSVSPSSSSTTIGWSKNSFQILSLYHNLLSMFCLLPNGSQGYALTKQTFQRYQYNSSLLLMEDIHFIRLLRETSLQGGGKIKLLEQSIQISIDDILMIGILKHTFCNLLAYLLLFHTLLSEDSVYRWCYIRIPQSLRFITI